MNIILHTPSRLTRPFHAARGLPQPGRRHAIGQKGQACGAIENVDGDSVARALQINTRAATRLHDQPADLPNKVRPVDASGTALFELHAVGALTLSGHRKRV
eukprot:scaffold11985_cov112-Isochrysis_galbana.AAC.1